MRQADQSCEGDTTLNKQSKQAEKNEAASGNSKLIPPSISLPKGGGAIRGIGEKFAANPVTGTGSMSVPIAASPGRSGFGPQFSLSYDSISGNGPFGFGWSLSLPSITRRTDQGLPQYRDGEESDVFLLSGAEDLVPVLQPDGTRFKDETIAPGYVVHRYRPRVEGLFARIERWTRSDGDVHWRSVSKDNVLTLYGKDDNSRIADTKTPNRIFSWLICETRDDKGNAILYKYKPENGEGVDLTRANERNRGDRDDAGRKTNRYLKYVRYGNRTSLLDDAGHRPHFLTDSQIQNAGWLFEVVLDYGEHDADVPQPDSAGPWTFRNDPFSTYRAGFEVRTTRLCQRVLMFHRIPDLLSGEKGYDGLVRSTDFTYSYEQDPTSARNPVYTFLRSVTQTGYKRDSNGYVKRSLPPVEFQYTQPVVQDKVEDVAPESMENLPVGLDGALYQWTDLHGEGIPGILTEQDGTWFYKRNLSPINLKPGNGTSHVEAKFAPIELVAAMPNLSFASGAQFMDLAGDGQPDLVVLDGPMPGLYEHDDGEGWQPFRPFAARLNRDTRDPNLKFVDVDGDGHADVLVAEADAFVWHPSMTEAGFGAARRVTLPLDEEKGPHLVFADGTQSVYLADMSGDGLTDLVRIRNGEVSYWPNLGYGRFGAKVAMDHAPYFDNPDQFDHKRIRLADIDGSGTTDVIYLHRDGVRLYFNQSGNSWSEPQVLRVFPRVDDLVNIVPIDLLGNGTACLVWSSALPGDGKHPMRYVNLMGAQKPHLLVNIVNNLGAETNVEYAPSTKFYLQDKRDGKPWITRLPFPVHVVERVKTYDHVSRNRFVTRYVYHHGYFDGVEREFRGFGMVEQWDTERYAALEADGLLEDAENLDGAFHVPPVLTKTWFHTGAYVESGRTSRQFEEEYYHEGDPSLGETGLSEEQQEMLLLDDTVLPKDNLTPDEIGEAHRSLKGSILRQEIYAQDGTEKEDLPYSASEHNYTIKLLQPRGKNKHAVFFTHPRETIDLHYERKLRNADVAGQSVKIGDPRVGHTMTLAVDDYGNVERSVTIGYRRRNFPDVQEPDQKETHITLTASRFANCADKEDWYRVGVPVETRTYEIVEPPEPNMTGPIVQPFPFQAIQELLEGRQEAAFPGEALFPTDKVEPEDGKQWPYEKWDWRRNPANAPDETKVRLVEHVRTLYYDEDLAGPLPLNQVASHGLLYETYNLAFTPGLLSTVYRRKRGADEEDLLPVATRVGVLRDGGGYVLSEDYIARGWFPASDADGCWWDPSGQTLYSRVPKIPAPPRQPAPLPQDLNHAREHFFLPQGVRNPFGQLTRLSHDSHDLLLTTSEDPLANVIAAQNDYRVLQPRLVTDPNRNRSEVAFDALGLVVGTAVKGKAPPSPVEGDSLDGFVADLTQAQVDGFYDVNDPHVPAPDLLQDATTRIVYDLERFRRTQQAYPEDQTKWLPVYAATLARETHVSDGLPPDGLKVQISFSYSDGFGREVQKKIQAEPGPLVKGGPSVSPRWVGSGWTIFNNKGKPVRQYEPFFSQLPEKRHRFEFGAKEGVSTILFYDPVERVIATLHPNDTYDKVILDPWQQVTYDVNDTVAARGTQTGDPRTDPDIAAYVGAYFNTQPAAWQTWYGQRIGNPANDPQRDAAQKAAAHADTPTIAHFDSLGRAFLTIMHNRVVCPNHNLDGTEDELHTRVELDVEGNRRAVVDARGRVVMRYSYSMAGPAPDEEDAPTNRIHQASMEAGERWMLNDVAGNPICAWDSRGFTRRMTYDDLRRPTGLYVTENGAERLAEQTIYGEGQGDGANHRTRVYQARDGAGVVTNEAYDFKGNLRRSKRELLPDYQHAVNWLQNPGANYGAFITSTEYDALNRPTAVTTPDQSIYRPTYNEANLLDKVELNLRGAAATTGFVTNVDYNAKGQRLLIAYSNGAKTTYEYDPFTFRLTRLRTTRPAGQNGLASELFNDPAVVQDLSYTYDPAGNITRIEDAALKTVFNGSQIDPMGRYTYDALYRLIEAKGREHIGQTAFDFNPPDGNRRDYPLVGHQAHPNDPRAMRNYTERFEYDEVGNFQFMRHAVNGGGWNQRYEYEEDSLIEPGVKSNRLSRTTLGNGLNYAETYTYADAQDNDVHGCMTAINNMKMVWDFEDQLQQVDLGGGGMAYYVYDAAGQRVRKVWEKAPGLTEERVYLGGFEIFRRRNGANTVTLERETLHVMDDKQRIALVETRTQGNEPDVPAQLTRYQLGNHLGSASLELGGQTQIISFEEYHPYGTTSFQAVRSQTETPKRYRYTGKERDEESGLYYHGARYYAPWMGRWTAADPAGMEGGLNLFLYTNANPVTFADPSGAAPKPKPESLALAFLRWETSRGVDRLGWDFDKRRLAFAQWYGREYGAFLDPKELASLYALPQGASSTQTTIGMPGMGPTVPFKVIETEREASREALKRGGLTLNFYNEYRARGYSPVDAFANAEIGAGFEGLLASVGAAAARRAENLRIGESLSSDTRPKQWGAPTEGPDVPEASTRSMKLANESALRVRIFDKLWETKESALSTVRNAIGSQNAQFFRDLGFKERDIRNLLNSVEGSALRGKAYEQQLAKMIQQEPLLSQHVEYTANITTIGEHGSKGSIKPDFWVNTESSRIPADLTTFKQRGAHVERCDWMAILPY